MKPNLEETHVQQLMMRVKSREREREEEENQIDTIWKEPAEGETGKAGLYLLWQISSHISW